MFLLPQSILKKMLSCEEVANILSQSCEISFRARMHIFICQCCTDYQSQLNIIEIQSKKMGIIHLSDEQLKKIQALKTKINAKVKLL